MARSPVASKPKAQFSGHETFPLRQLWLRKAYVEVAAASSGSKARAVFADEDAIRRFGVGKNMVSSIRHWALACDVLAEEKGENLTVGPVGEFLFGEKGVDPYLERPATAWLMHWQLAGPARRSSAWRWVFNHVTQQTFTRASLQAGLRAFVDKNGIKLSDITLRRDIEVCIRCYVSRRSKKEGDDSAEPLLADLGLLIEGQGETFQFRRGTHPSLPNGIFAYALLDFWNDFRASQKTLSLEAITHEVGSPGRVFKLDENAVAERVLELNDLTRSKMQWTDSAGIRQVSIAPGLDIEDLKIRVLRGAYGR